MTTIAIQSPFVFRMTYQNTGSSEESYKIHEMHQDLKRELTKANWWRNALHSRTTEELEQIYQDCRKHNWDGYHALPVSSAVFEEAKQFIGALPSSVPSPDVAAEPGGEIGFEWHFGKNKIFVASISGTNYISYAGLLGIGMKAQGREVFDGSIPQTIIDFILRLARNVKEGD